MSHYSQDIARLIKERRIIEGVENNLMAIRPVKYQFAEDLTALGQKNDWKQTEIALNQDVLQYTTGQLTGGNLAAYRKALAFLSNLDGIQFSNLVMNIGRNITAPEIKMFIARQAWEEALHVRAYAQMIETIGFDPYEIYFMFRDDGILSKKNDYIMQSSMILGKEFTPHNFAKAIAANIILEGVYFYNGFLTFYAIEKQGLMPGSAEMIRLIQRDEIVHLTFFTELWHAFREENKRVITKKLIEDVYQLFRLGVDLESEWGAYIIQDGVLGLTPATSRGFIESLADKRLIGMGLDPLYSTINPIPWFDSASSIQSEKANFFEGRVGAYQTGALEW